MGLDADGVADGVAVAVVAANIVGVVCDVATAGVERVAAADRTAKSPSLDARPWLFVSNHGLSV